jgi:hypothetical protein
MVLALVVASLSVLLPEILSNVVGEWLTLVLCIWEVSGSIIGLNFCGFSQCLQANAGIVDKLKLIYDRFLPNLSSSSSFTCHTIMDAM